MAQELHQVRFDLREVEFAVKLCRAHELREKVGTRTQFGDYIFPSSPRVEVDYIYSDDDGSGSGWDDDGTAIGFRNSSP